MKTTTIGQITIDDLAEYEDNRREILQSSRNPLKRINASLNLAGNNTMQGILNNHFWPSFYEEVSSVLRCRYGTKPNSMRVLVGHGTAKHGIYRLLSTGDSVQRWVNKWDGTADVLFTLVCNNYFEGGNSIPGGELLVPCKRSYLLYPRSECSIPQIYLSMKKDQLERELYLVSPCPK